jgi:phosphoglycerol transferase MdoB-like AlkP superfamily enzyme
MQNPFFCSVFTISSHHPYNIPNKYKHTLPNGPLPIHQSIAYTDLSLKRFFEAAEKSAWYKNTIFVVTGDHTSYGTDDYFYSESGHYEIPLLIFGPGITPRVSDKTVSQCDIGPTLLDLAQIPNKWFALGQSALDNSYQGFSIHYSDGRYYIIQYPNILAMDEGGKILSYTQRLRNSHTEIPLEKKGENYQFMLRHLQAYLQVYSHRLRENKWN